jgi:hypothetical protein
MKLRSKTKIFLSIFFAVPHTPPPLRRKYNGKEKFWVLPRDWKERPRRALGCFKMGSRKREQFFTKRKKHHLERGGVF